jgi:hypothetical protein
MSYIMTVGRGTHPLHPGAACTDLITAARSIFLYLNCMRRLDDLMNLQNVAQAGSEISPSG